MGKWCIEMKCTEKRKTSFKAQLENLLAGNQENHKKTSVSFADLLFS